MDDSPGRRGGKPDGSHRDPPALAFPPNPQYGSGSMRRRVVLEVGPAEVRGWLGDAFHEMECEITLGGCEVASASGRMIRYPTTSCPGAPDGLDDLRGAQLGELPSRYYRRTAGPRQCTHLYDLAVLAVSHGQQPAGSYAYEALVPDETDRPVSAEAIVDGERALAWLVHRGEIVDGPHRGSPVTAGFVRWAEQAFAGRALAAALVLARTCMVARGRAYDAEAWAGSSTSLNAPQRGRCFAYSGAAFDTGLFRAGYTRDVSAAVAPSAAEPGAT